MAKRSYIPRDHPGIRQRALALVKAAQFGRSRPAAIGQALYDELRAALPPGLAALIDATAPDLAAIALKGCVQMAKEEYARGCLDVSGRPSTAAFFGAKVRDGKDTYYLRASQLCMTLAEAQALLNRYDRQIDTLQAHRTEMAWRVALHEQHPQAVTFAEALVAAGVQYEMVFEDAI